MSRRHKAQHRPVIADAKYESELLAHVINHIMRSGKKSTAQRIVYGALEKIKEKTGEAPLDVLSKAIENVKPRVEVKSRRVGGATYQVPVEVSRKRQLALAMRWLLQFASNRKGMPMQQALALELIDAYNENGSAVKKRDDTHKMAQANKAFAHYRW